MEVNFLFKAFVSFALLLTLGLLFRLYNALVANPRRLRRAMNKQGIGGPQPTLLLGNLLQIKRALSSGPKAAAATAGPPDSHNCTAHLFPFLEKWRRQYGDIFMFSLGNAQVLQVNQYDVVREITTYTSLDLGLPSYLAKDLHSLLGDGILTSNGNFWAYQRKILAPQLFMHKVEGMTSLMQECALMLINSWKDVIDGEGGKADINIDNDLRRFSGDVTSRACFGSSYAEGQLLFQKLKSLQQISGKKGFFVGIPGMGYIPTKSNREEWKLEKDVRALILKLIKQKTEANLEKNLLTMVLEEAEKSENLSPDAVERFTVDNCKNIYLAGYESTAVAATWCLMLLATNQEWQDRVRAEVIEICQGKVPDSDSIKKMKQLTMVINESLRLYPPSPVVPREALKDLKFGNIHIPKGLTIWMVVTTLHTDSAIWGPDSYQFKPERFTNGVSGACKLPNLYMPFGIGTRMCLGQNLAMVELKILVSLILSKFTLSLSPKYVHSPVMDLTVKPENGVDLVMEKL